MKKSAIVVLATFFLVSAVHAQADVEVAGQDVGTWFKNNWMWVAGLVLLLIIILLSIGGKRKRKSTTVVKDDLGNVKSVTRTEEVD
jgi:hypothetical protein